MGKLLRRSKEFLDELENLEKLQKKKQQVASYSNWAETLDVERKQLARVSDAVRRLRDAKLGVELDVEPKKIESQMKRLKKLRDISEGEKPEDLTKNKNYKDFLTQNKEFVKIHQRAAETAWTRFIQDTKKATGINRGVLEALKDTDDDLDAQIDQIFRGYDELGNYQDKTDYSEETIALIEKSAEQLRILNQALPKLDDPDIETFLKSTQSNSGAKLSLLTPKVLEWLKENKLMDSFCIKNYS